MAIVLLAGLAGCTHPSDPSAARVHCRPQVGSCFGTPETSLGQGAHSVSLLVEPHDGVASVVKALDAAHNRIFVSAYILSDHRIVHALDRAAAQGVHVFVLLDQTPFGLYRQPDTMFNELRAAGVLVKWSSGRFVYDHAKFMVLDDHMAIISSANFSQSGFASDRDFVVIDHDSRDVREADNIFRSDWDRVNPVLNDSNLIVSPSGSRVQLVALISRAHSTVDVYSEEMLDPGMARVLMTAAQRGIRVRVLAATTTSRLLRNLRRQGVTVKTVSRRHLYLHAKAIIVDGKVGFVGSENFSATSLDHNRELGVLIRKQLTVNRLESTFAADWG